MKRPRIKFQLRSEAQVTEGDAVTIVAYPPAALDPSSIVIGSIKKACARCGQDVMVAPSSQSLLRHKNAVCVCIKCALGDLIESLHDGEDLSVNLTPAQVREFHRHRAIEAMLERIERTSD